MNARMLTSLVVVCAALTSMASAAVPSAGTPLAYNVKVASTDDFLLQRGATRSEMLRMLGVPLSCSTEDVWLYSGYHLEEGSAPDNHGCNILVVTLSKGRVTDIKLVNRPAAAVVARAARAGKPVVYVPKDARTMVAQER